MPLPHRMLARLATSVLTATLALPSVHATTRAEDTAKADEALIVSKQALEFFVQGNHAVAIELYLKAYALDPKPEYLYGAARAEQEAGRLDAAISHFQLALAQMKPGSPLAIKTQTYLDKAKAARAAVVVPPPVVAPKPPPEPAIEPKPAPPKVETPVVATPTVVQAQPVAWRAPVAWSAIVLGAVGLGAAGVIWSGADDDQAALDSRRAIKVGGKIVGITAAESDARQADINDRIHQTWLLAGVGGAAAIAGVALLVIAPRGRVAIAPTVDGARVALRF